jgi:hypothetical protein
VAILASLSATGFLFGQRVAASGATCLAAYGAAPGGGTVTLIGNATNVSTALSSGPLAVGAVSGQNYSGKRISAVSIGKSMVLADIQKFYDRLQAYMTAIGNS